MLKRLFRFLPFFFLLLGSATSLAQTDSTKLTRLLANYRIVPSLGLQSWATYTMGMEVLDPTSNTYRAVDNRLNFQLRRTRLALNGQPYDRLRFSFVTALDQLGSDALAATQAGSTNGLAVNFRVWNAWLQYALKPESDGLYLLAGYFVPPVGRETTTPALRSTSFEKSGSQFYLRRHLLNSGPGRAYGLMLAGQQHALSGNLHLTYEAALTNPAFAGFDGNSVGEAYSPLVSGRLSVHLGDAEATTYNINRRVNYFGKRRGLTVALAGGRQGGSDLYASNGAYGAEWLANHSGWQIDGEWLRLSREAAGSNYRAHTGYLRVGRNYVLPREWTLEPVAMYWWFAGPEGGSELSQADKLNGFTGRDRGFDLGMNWYLNPDCRLSLFYALRQGGAVASGETLARNSYFQQGGIGGIRRGNYLGFGWVVFL